MQQDVFTIQAVEIVRARLRHGVKATPLCVAMMGWLAQMPTTPFVAAARLQGGEVWVRLSDEEAAEPLGSFLDFLDQICVIGKALNMSEPQTQHLVALARQQLS